MLHPPGMGVGKCLFLPGLPLPCHHLRDLQHRVSAPCVIAGAWMPMKCHQAISSISPLPMPGVCPLEGLLSSPSPQEDFSLSSPASASSPQHPHITCHQGCHSLLNSPTAPKSLSSLPWGCTMISVGELIQHRITLPRKPLPRPCLDSTAAGEMFLGTLRVRLTHPCICRITE